MVHLFCWNSFVEPVRWSTLQTNKNPSFPNPREARNLPSGDHATALTPNPCSLMETRGLSDELSCNPKIRTRGAYPVSPTARNLPSLLKDTHVAAFIRSRLVHVFDVGESDQSGEPYVATLFLLSFAFGVVLELYAVCVIGVMG